MTALTASFTELGPRIALGAALLVSACQHDSSALFDDSQLTAPDAGGSSDTGGSEADAGATSQGATAAGGGKASAGSSFGGEASGGTAGGSGGKTTGSGGKAGNGGKAGADAGGAAGKAGQGGQAGRGGAGGGGMGGVKDPGPVTIDITDIADTDVSSCMTSAHGEEKTINVDGDNSCVVYSLLNASLQEIPDGAVVSQATLTLDCVNAGDPASVYFVNESWSEDSVRWGNRPDVGALLGSVSCDTLGAVTIDLKAAVKAWLGGDHAAYGIYLRMETTDGIDFSTSEADNEAERPTLTITYNPSK